MILPGLLWDRTKLCIASNLAATQFCEASGTDCFPKELVIKRFMDDLRRTLTLLFEVAGCHRAYIQIHEAKPKFYFFPPAICAYVENSCLSRVEETPPLIIIEAPPLESLSINLAFEFREFNKCVEQISELKLLINAGQDDRLHYFNFPQKWTSIGPTNVYIFDKGTGEQLQNVAKEIEWDIACVYTKYLLGTEGSFNAYVV